jgi:hypothetical protein
MLIASEKVSNYLESFSDGLPMHRDAISATERNINIFQKDAIYVLPLSVPSSPQGRQQPAPLHPMYWLT